MSWLDPGKTGAEQAYDTGLNQYINANTPAWDSGQSSGWSVPGMVSGYGPDQPNAYDQGYQKQVADATAAYRTSLPADTLAQIDADIKRRTDVGSKHSKLAGMAALAAVGGAGLAFGAPVAAGGAAAAGGATAFPVYGGTVPMFSDIAAGAAAGGAATAGGGSVLGSWSGWNIDPSMIMSSLGSGGSASFLPSTLKDWASIGSGFYGMYKSNQQSKMAQQAINASAPWTASGGTAMAGDELKRTISGDLSGDPGFKLAQAAAARASSQQPGGFASMAAANAALNYRMQMMQALSGPAGVGFNPAAGYQTALGGQQLANTLAGQSLGSIGYGLSGNSIPPWLQAYLAQHGMGG